MDAFGNARALRKADSSGISGVLSPTGPWLCHQYPTSPLVQKSCWTYSGESKVHVSIVSKNLKSVFGHRSPRNSLPAHSHLLCALSYVLPYYTLWANVIASPKPSRPSFPTGHVLQPLHLPAGCTHLQGSPVLHCNFLSLPEADTAQGQAHRRCSVNV